jgi:low affinity Fe/Cu permease
MCRRLIDDTEQRKAINWGLSSRSAMEWHSGGLVSAAKVTVKVTQESAEELLNAKPTALATGSERFGKFAARSSYYLGSRWSFVAAIGVIVVWALTGPIFHYSDTWQLVINTGTTIVTFLMVFLIQNTQNRDARAIHLKLNELIHALDKAKNQMIDVENLSDLELEELTKTYEQIRAGAQDRRQMRKAASPQ